MSGMESSTTRERAIRWRNKFSWVFSVCAVAVLCVAVNRFWNLETATAQAPVTRGSVRGNTDSNTKPAPVTTPQKSPTAAAKSSASDTPRTASATNRPAGAKPNSPAASTPELKVVAVVNGEQVTRQDLARECLIRYGKDVLESMVNKHVIMQACQKRNISITEQDVEDEVTRIAGKFGLSNDRWLKLLSEERKVSPDEYRREIIWPTLALRSLAADQIEVSQEELRKAFESEYGAQVRVRMIVLDKKDEADKVYAKAKAHPDDFENLAKEHSKDPSASVLGLVPPIRKHVGDVNLEKAAFALKAGELSPVVKVANQYILLKCEQHIPASLPTGAALDAAREQLKDRISDQKMRFASATLFKKLQDEAKVVNVFNDPLKQKQMPGVAATINGKTITITQLSEECIVRHGETVLDGEINRKILTQELKKRNKNVSEEDINAEVARAADTYGQLKPDGSPDVEAWLKEVTEKQGATVELYVSDAVWPSAALKKLVDAKVTVTEDDLKKGFESNYGERVETLAIVLSNQRTAQQVWQQARDNPTDNFFGELANQYSVEPASRANFGKVPPIRRHGGQPVVEEQAFKLKAGQLSPIISVTDKFIILRCLGRTKPIIESMDASVRAELKKDLLEKKLRIAMSQEFDQLKEKSQVDNFLAGTTHDGKQPKTNTTSNKEPGVPAKNPAPLATPRVGSNPRTTNPVQPASATK